MKRDLFRKASRAMLLTATLLLSAWWPNHAKAQEIGDILCTDGTVVSPENYATSGKTAKGIIFFIDPQNTSQGLVVALKDASEEPVKFSEHTDEIGCQVKDIILASSTRNGRATTGILRGIPEHVAAKQISKADYDAGWYLPASGELKLLNAHIGRVQKGLLAVDAKNAGSATTMAGEGYWSSTEAGNTTSRAAWYIPGHNHMTAGGFFSKQYQVRAIALTTLPTNTPEHKIGDLMTFDDGSKGVVFFTENGGKQGWVVSMKQSTTQERWSSTVNEALTSALNLAPFATTWELAPNTKDMGSGKRNTRIIRNIGTAEQYPAVHNIPEADFNNGWYLGSAGQLQTLSGIKYIIDDVLLANNGDKVEHTWSSAPGDNSRAWYLSVDKMYLAEKDNTIKLRTLRSFGYPNLTIANAANGKIDATPDTDVAEHAWVTITPTSNPGCALKSIKAFKTGEESTTLTITANQFRMPMHDVTIAAEFVAGAGKDISIAEGIANGSITTDITTNIAENAEVTIHVIPAPGYRIKAGSLKATDTSNPSIGLAITGNSFLMPDFDVTLTAEFEVFAYNIAIDPNTVNGTVVAEPGQDIQPGTEVTLTPQPAAGYQYKAGSLKVCRTSNPAIIITPSAEGKITMPSYDLTVSAEFEALTYAVAIATGIEHGTLSASPNGNVATGTEITVTATPAAGYQLKEGSLKAYKTDEPSVEIAINGGLFTMPAYNATITAEFEVATPTTYTVLIGDLEYGDITATPSANVATGTEVTLTATPAAGYRLKAGSLKAFKPDDQSVTVTITNNKFTMPAYNVLVKGEFELNTGIETPASAALTLYPNPANNNVYINGITSATQVDIYSIVGALTLSTQIEPNQPISLNGLKAGVYLVKVNGQTLRLVKK